MVTIGIMLSVDVILLGSNEYSNRYTWAFQDHNSTHDQVPWDLSYLKILTRYLKWLFYTIPAPGPFMNIKT